jgi:hypothetical protein
MKSLVLNLLQFSQIKYRKIRFVACLILNTIYKNILDEAENTKKLLQRMSEIKQQTLTKLVGSGDPSSKLNKLNDFLNVLRDKYIIFRSSDVDQQIRKAICDLLAKECKNSFGEIFKGKLPNYYKFFLSETDNKIKVKYMGLLYERIQKNIPEEEEVIMKILSENRKIIINLCLSENNTLAKPAIKIIEILSEMKLLSDETVNSLLPHLFNSEAAIRNLITKVVLNTILNFSTKSEKESEEIKESKEKEEIEFSFENFVEVIEFIYKLTGNENNMISILVMNLYDQSDFLSHYDFYFKFLELLMKQENHSNIEISQPPNLLISTVIKTLSFCIRELQKRINNSIEKNQNLISKNEEFINHFCINIYQILNGLMMEDIENFNEILNLFENFIIFDQNLVKLEQRSFMDILKSLQKAFFLNYSFKNIKLEAYESLMEKLLKAINILQNNKSLVGLNKEYKTCFEQLTSTFNQSFIELYNNEISQASQISAMNLHKIYSIYVQFFSLLKYNSLSNSNFVISDSMFFLIKILNYCSQNYKELTERNSLDLIERLVQISLNIGNEITYVEFNRYLNFSSNLNLDIHNLGSKIKEYVKYRTDFLQFIHNLIQISDDSDKSVYFSMLNVKTRGICILLEIYIYSTSEKLREIASCAELYYAIPNLITNILEDFLRNNFIKFFDKYATIINEPQEDENGEAKKNDEANSIDSEEENDMVDKNETNDKNQKIIDDEKEIMKKKKNEEFVLFFTNFKSICESFSKLLILNLGVFKYKSFCSLYFESFLLLRMPIIIRNITDIVIERILEKELENYESQNLNNPLNIIIYFVTKTIIKLYINKITLFNYREIEFNQKCEMIKNIFKSYYHCIPKLRRRFKENVKKDKVFYTNFIYNSLMMALENKEEIQEEDNKTIVHLKNISMIEILQILVKKKLFFDENDYKLILGAYMKITEEFYALENLHYKDFTVLEKMKKILITKSNLYQKAPKNIKEKKNEVIVEVEHEEEEEKNKVVEVNESKNEEKESNKERKTTSKKNNKEKVKKNKKRNFDSSGLENVSGKKKKEK